MTDNENFIIVFHSNHSFLFMLFLLLLSSATSCRRRQTRQNRRFHRNGESFLQKDHRRRNFHISPFLVKNEFVNNKNEFPNEGENVFSTHQPNTRDYFSPTQRETEKIEFPSPEESIEGHTDYSFYVSPTSEKSKTYLNTNHETSLKLEEKTSSDVLNTEIYQSSTNKKFITDTFDSTTNPGAITHVTRTEYATYTHSRTQTIKPTESSSQFTKTPSPTQNHTTKFATPLESEITLSSTSMIPTYSQTLKTCTSPATQSLSKYNSDTKTHTKDPITQVITTNPTSSTSPTASASQIIHTDIPQTNDSKNFWKSSNGIIVIIVIVLIIITILILISVYLLKSKKHRNYTAQSEDSWHDPMRYTIDAELIDVN